MIWNMSVWKICYELSKIFKFQKAFLNNLLSRFVEDSFIIVMNRQNGYYNLSVKDELNQSQLVIFCMSFVSPIQ